MRRFLLGLLDGFATGFGWGLGGGLGVLFTWEIARRIFVAAAR